MTYFCLSARASRRPCRRLPLSCSCERSKALGLPVPPRHAIPRCDRCRRFCARPAVNEQDRLVPQSAAPVLGRSVIRAGRFPL